MKFQALIPLSFFYPKNIFSIEKLEKDGYRWVVEGYNIHFLTWNTNTTLYTLVHGEENMYTPKRLKRKYVEEINELIKGLIGS